MPALDSPPDGPGCGQLATRTAADDALLSRIIPLWVGRAPDGGLRPSVIYGAGSILISATREHPCDGAWQLHLFAFSYEARQAMQTVKLLYPAQSCEAAARPNGEGLLLIKVGEGAFECRIVDRRGTRDQPAFGSWQHPDAVARQAALHIPAAPQGQARHVARQVLSELTSPSQKSELCAQMGCRNRLDDRPVGQVRLEEVLSAANRLLEPTGMEVTCSDRQVLRFIDDHLAATPFDMQGMVDRIAHDLVAQLAEEGGIG